MVGIEKKVFGANFVFILLLQQLQLCCLAQEITIVESVESIGCCSTSEQTSL